MSFFVIILLLSTGILGYLFWRQTLRVAVMEQDHRTLVQERARVLDFIQDVGGAFVEGIPQDEIYRHILTSAVHIAEARSGAFFLLNDKKDALVAAVIDGPFPPPIRPDDHIEDKLVTRSIYLEQLIKKQKISLKDGILGEVFTQGTPLLLKNPASDPRIPHYESDILRIDTFLAVPLTFRDQRLGVMALANTRHEQPFTEADLSLMTTLASQASFAIFNVQLRSVMAEKERLDRDLEIAREIQCILLPSTPPTIKEMDVAALNVPAQEVGGDYYDFVRVDDERWGFAIADVSGKGVSGALIMAMCRSALRAKALGNPSPADVLKRVNRLIFPDMKEDMFIGLNYGVLNTRTREFAFCRAGHEPGIHFCPGGKRVDILAPRGMALGIDNGDVFDTALLEQHVQLQKGDSLVFYTDGITEALDESGQEFEREHLIEAIETCVGLSAAETAKNIEARVRRFIGKRAQNDDITIMVVNI